MRRPQGTAPAKLPDPQPRNRRDGEERASFLVTLQVVTPILGGGVKTRDVDHVDIIRVPTIRGHLRFWWRALEGHGYTTASELRTAEKALWGGATNNTANSGTRSPVELALRVTAKGDVDGSEVGPATPGAYALWPARKTNAERTALRRMAGTTFELRVNCPAAEELQVRNALRAWILFGGYGGRTRRGVGSLAVADEAQRAEWAAPTNAEQLGALLATMAGGAAGVMPAGRLRDVAGLADAGLRIGNPTTAQAAWLKALDWLQQFRQGVRTAHGGVRPRARAAVDPQIPSVTDWPEPDMMRLLSPPVLDHAPRHTTAGGYLWPRASFGLPMQTKWKRNRRVGAGYYDEPGDYELHWVDANEQQRDRLASPLIVKAMQMTDGQFVPIALWLDRGYPVGGQVQAGWVSGGAIPGSNGDFDMLQNTGPTQYAPLTSVTASAEPSGRRMRTAFFEWLAVEFTPTVVLP